MMTQVVDDKPDIVHELRRRIRAYKRLHPNLTSQQIARRFEMSNTTFNRFENSEIKKPTFEQIFKILKGVGAEDELISFIKENYPELVYTIENLVERNLPKRPKAKLGMLDEMANDEYGKLLRYIISKVGKVNREEIQKNFGNFGISNLEKLTQYGVIKEENGYFFPYQEYRKRHSANQQRLKEIIVKEISESFHCNPPKNEASLNYIRYISDHIDAKKVMPQIIAELEIASERIKDILSKEENKGETPFWLTFASDTFIQNKLRKEISQKEISND